MPVRPVQVEKLRNQMAMPTTRPSSSATWAKTVGDVAEQGGAQLIRLDLHRVGRSLVLGQIVDELDQGVDVVLDGRPDHRLRLAERTGASSGDQQHPAEGLPALDVGVGLAGLLEGEAPVDDHPQLARGDVGQQCRRSWRGPGVRGRARRPRKYPTRVWLLARMVEMSSLAAGSRPASPKVMHRPR